MSFKQLRELKAKRHTLKQSAQQLFDTAQGEKRALTEAEQKTFDTTMSEVEQLDADIDSKLRTMETENQEYSEDDSSGLVVRALRPKDKLEHRISKGWNNERLSLARALRGMVLGDWTSAEAEFRAMGGNTGSLGGWLVPTDVSAYVIDLARNKSVAIQAGALTVPMETPDLIIVKLKTDPQGHWRDENSTIDESDATFEPLKLKALALGCLCRMSVELLEDATALNQTVENAIAQSLALELDRAALFGSGTGEPRGLFNTPDVNELSLGANGASLTNYDKFSEAVESVASNNGTATALVMAPRTMGSVDRLKDSTSQPLNPPESYRALARLVSNQVPTNLAQGTSLNCSAAVVGDFSQMVIGMRTQLVLEASRYAGDAFSKMQVLIRGYIRADVGVVRPRHFTKIVGIRP